jgi:hypothetical protein
VIGYFREPEKRDRRRALIFSDIYAVEDPGAPKVCAISRA